MCYESCNAFTKKYPASNIFSNGEFGKSGRLPKISIIL